MQAETQATFGGDMIFALRSIARRWYWIPVGAILGAFAAILYLRSAAYTYSIEMTVAPTQGAPMSGGGALGGLASVAGVSLSSTTTVAPIDLYIRQLQSREVASDLASRRELMITIFSGEWDATAGRWREPNSWRTKLSRGVKSILGIPTPKWHPPGGARMQAYIGSTILIEKADRQAIVTVSLNHPSPRFGSYLLSELHTATDALLRRKAILKATEYVAYLKATLPGVQVAEQRAALANLLSEQEKARMLASSTSPYAVDVIDVPHASDTTTYPRPMLVLLGATMGGGAIALGVLLALFQLRRKS